MDCLRWCVAWMAVVAVFPPEPPGGWIADDSRPHVKPGQVVEQPFLVINEAALSAIAPEHELVIYSPTWCSVCRAMEPEIGDGDAEVHVEWVHDESQFPAFIRQIGSYPVVYYKAKHKYVAHRQSLADYKVSFDLKPSSQFQQKLRSTGAWGQLRAKSQVQASLRGLLPLLRGTNSLGMSYSGSEVPFESAGVKIAFSGRTTVSLKSDGDAVVATISPAAKLSYGWMKASVTGFRLSEEQVQLTIPGFFDPVIQLVE